jgi:hypothetical protein
MTVSDAYEVHNSGFVTDPQCVLCEIGAHCVQARSTRNSPTTLCPQHCILLPAETLVKRKRFFNLSLAILKNYELFTYADMRHITSLVRKGAIKIAIP